MMCLGVFSTPPKNMMCILGVETWYHHFGSMLPIFVEYLFGGCYRIEYRRRPRAMGGLFPELSTIRDRCRGISICRHLSYWDTMVEVVEGEISKNLLMFIARHPGFPILPRSIHGFNALVLLLTDGPADQQKIVFVRNPLGVAENYRIPSTNLTYPLVN